MNQVRAGTGPFQRAIRLDDKAFDITILSCYDTQREVSSTASLLESDFGKRKVLGFGEKNKIILFFKLLRYLRQEKPDIVQTAHTYTSILAILICRFFVFSMVVNFEGTLFYRKGTVNSFLTKFAYSFAHAAICVSNAVHKANSFSEDFLRKHMPRRVIYNGVDLSQIDAATRGNFDWQDRIKDNSFVVGFVGDLKPVKDIPTLIRALKVAIKKSDNIVLLIIGGGELENELTQQAVSAGVIDNVIFAGQVERFEVYSALKLMDVFVMPSLIEGLSEAIAQAMASSLPIVASDIAPNRELIVSNENGFLFDNGNYKLLAEHLLVLLGDSDLRNKFALKNRKVAEQKLDIYNIVEQYKNFYFDLLASKGAKQ